VGLNSGRIFWSSAHTDVNGGSQGKCLGGLVGTNVVGKIVSCCARGGLAGEDSLGGLVGNNVEGVILDCYAQGSISEHFGLHSGGLVGYNRAGVIVNCYAGAVLWNGGERWDWGGLIGFQSPRFIGEGRVIGSTVANSFWDVEISGVSVSSGGMALSTSQMHRRESFTGWDFDHVWTIHEGKDYPRLRWENGQEETGPVTYYGL
jgi:hypothetical protein